MSIFFLCSDVCMSREQEITNQLRVLNFFFKFVTRVSRPSHASPWTRRELWPGDGSRVQGWTVDNGFELFSFFSPCLKEDKMVMNR